MTNKEKHKELCENNCDHYDDEIPLLFCVRFMMMGTSKMDKYWLEKCKEKCPFFLEHEILGWDKNEQ